MSKNTMRIGMVVIALVIIVPIVILIATNVGSKPEPTPTVDPNLIMTAAAQTADARLTELAVITPSSTPVPPSATPDPALTALVLTAEAQMTQVQLTVAVLTLTPPAPATATPGPTISQADLAIFEKDVTIPDGYDLNPGAAFTKTWRIKNNGTSTWTTDYALVFISGDKLGENTVAPLPGPVVPGASVDISVNLTAPATGGTYTSYWKMRNASNQLFNEPVYVQIDVIAGAGTPLPSPTAGTPPAVTPTATGAPGGLITNLSFAVDEPAYIGPCPHNLTFSASFTVNQAATLTYQLVAGSDTPGFEFQLPAPASSAFGTGPISLSFPLNISSSVVGWVQFQITSPVSLSSNKVSFTLTCQP